jgi:hypothetical protein
VEVAFAASYGGATGETRRRHSQAGGSLQHSNQGHDGALNATGKMAKQRGDHSGAHLGQQMTRQTAVVANNGTAAPPDSGDGGGSMWGSSGYKKMMGGFEKMSLSSSQLQLRRVVATMAKVATQFGSKICMI